MTEDAGVLTGSRPPAYRVDEARAASEVDAAAHQLCDVLRLPSLFRRP